MLDRIMSWIDENPVLFLTAVFLSVFCLSQAAWVFFSHMEAQAYSRITGEQVSTWDAMWVELRVDRK